MRVPKKTVCIYINLYKPDANYICDVDEQGWGSCGDGVVDEFGEICPWAIRVLEWQDIEPIFISKKPHGKDS